MAKPIFWAPKTIAVFMPMTSPSIFTNGPPEFPGLIAASVWMSPRSSVTGSFSPVFAVIERESPETIPLETVFLNIPRVFPMAMASSRVLYQANFRVLRLEALLR